MQTFRTFDKRLIHFDYSSIAEPHLPKEQRRSDPDVPERKQPATPCAAHISHILYATLRTAPYPTSVDGTARYIADGNASTTRRNLIQLLHPEGV